MSEEMRSMNDRLSPQKARIMKFVEEELLSLEEQEDRNRAKELAYLMHTGGQMSAQQSVGTPERRDSPKLPYVPEVFYVDGVEDSIDLSSLPLSKRAEFMQSLGDEMPNIVAVSKDAGIIEDGLELPPAFEKKRKFKRPSRRVLLIGGASLAAVVAGGGIAAANGIVPMSVPGFMQNQNEADLTAQAPMEINAASGPIASAPAPDAAPEVKLDASLFAVGDCLDENGQGKAVASATMDISVGQEYKIKTLSGEEAILVDENDATPKTDIPGAQVNIAACIPTESLAEAVTVEGEKVIVNWDKIDRQLGIVPGEKGLVFVPWDLEPTPGLTDRATIAALATALNDHANRNHAANIARAEVAKQFISEKNANIQTELEEGLKIEFNSQATALHDAKKSPVNTVNVEFKGTPKEITYKGPSAEGSPLFNASDITKSEAVFK